MTSSTHLLLGQAATASDTDTAIGLVVIGIIAIIVYFLPTLIAGLRNHTSTMAIFAVNLIFGVSGLGWIVALIWALADNGRNRGAVVYQINHAVPPVPTTYAPTSTPVQPTYIPTPPIQINQALYPTVGGKTGACPYCGSIVSAQAIFCPHCSTSIVPGLIRPFNP